MVPIVHTWWSSEQTFFSDKFPQNIIGKFFNRKVTFLNELLREHFKQLPGLDSNKKKQILGSRCNALSFSQNTFTMFQEN